MIQGQNKKKEWKSILLCITVFLVMLVFFTVLHPIPIMDEDDVIYTVLVRKAVPIPGAWNPSRMMPEVLTSLCGNIAALCAAFGLGRFIDCQVTVYGIVFSLFITAYVWAFFRLLRIRFSCSQFQAVCLSALFLMLHFLVFRTEISQNDYLFHTYDACCVFYYTVPAIFGCTLVMWFMATPDDLPILVGNHLAHESVLMLALYFEVFSNLFGSAILAAYAVYRLLRSAHRKEKPFWKQNLLWSGIFLFWILAAVLEATGGRAAGARTQAISGTLEFPAKVVQAVTLFSGKMWHSNLLFRFMLLATVIGTALLMLYRPDRSMNTKALRTVGETAVWGFFTSLAVLLLCAAAEPLYAGRPEAVFPIVFVVLLLLMLGINFILKRVSFTVRLLPILLILVYTMINTHSLTFQDSNPLLLDGHVAVAIENEIYEKIIESAKAGETEITVDVIHSSESANWPHDGRIGDPIAKFFYKYGIIDHEIRVHTQPSDEMNMRYHIPVP